jgi:hypothetical protein
MVKRILEKGPSHCISKEYLHMKNISMHIDITL